MKYYEYLPFYRASKISLNYKCESGTVEEGSNKCNSDNQALKNYVQTGNIVVNQYLNDPSEMSESDQTYARDQIKELDRAFESASLDHDVVAYHGFGAKAANNMPYNWNKVGAKIDVEQFLSLGGESTAKGFVQGGIRDPSILAEVHLPKGAKAIDLEGINPYEGEYLVDRSTKFKVIDYRTENIYGLGETHIPVWEAITPVLKTKQNSGPPLSTTFYQKLNYRCPKGTVDDTYSCGNTPEERKKNYDATHGKDAAKDKTSKKEVDKKGPKTSVDPKKVKAVKDAVDRVKSEEKAGKVSKESVKALKDALDYKPDINKILNKVVSGKPVTPDEFDFMNKRGNAGIWRSDNRDAMTGITSKSTSNVNVPKESLTNYDNIVKQSEKLINSSKDVRNAIENYTDIEGCYLVNGYLGGQITEHDVEAKEARNQVDKLDQVFDEVVPITTDVLLWRTPSQGELDRILKTTNTKNIEDLVGKTLARPTFTSTSRNEKIGKTFGNKGNGAYYEITVPKGTKALAVDSASNEDFSDVGEVLLNRGSSWKVENVQKDDSGMYKISVTINK
jgi:hypothetical protein